MAYDFKILFHGELQNSHHGEQVKQRLARLLGHTPEYWHNCIYGNHSFIKDELDFVTANRYRRLFQQAGAIAHLLPIISCPECDCRQKKTVCCVRCGHNLEFPGTDQQRRQRQHQRNYQQRAVRGLSIGFGLFSAALITDHYLMSMHIDWQWLYLLCLPPFVYGCRYYAQA